MIKRSWGQDSAPVGRAHADPLFDTRECDIEFTDGSIKRHAANIIAQNMHAQVDSEGHQHLIMDEIVNHEADAVAAPVSEGCCALPNGNQKVKMTARGWKLLAQWKDGLVSWEKSKDLKDSNLIEVAEHAVADQLVDEPAFNWWVPFTLRKCNRIISKVKNRCWRMTHKFGIKLPHSVEEALKIDEETGTDHWRKAIDKEMVKVKVAWKTHWPAARIWWGRSRCRRAATHTGPRRPARRGPRKPPPVPTA